MARSGNKCTYSLIKGLYGELEKARREYEADAKSEGGNAYGLWLELLEIAEWHFEGAPGLEGDSADVEDHVDADAGADVDGPDGGRRQLELPGTGGMAPGVPRGTPGSDHQPVAVVGPASQLSKADLLAELSRRGMLVTGGKEVRRGTP